MHYSVGNKWSFSTAQFFIRLGPTISIAIWFCVCVCRCCVCIVYLIPFDILFLLAVELLCRCLFFFLFSSFRFVSFHFVSLLFFSFVCVCFISQRTKCRHVRASFLHHEQRWTIWQMEFYFPGEFKFKIRSGTCVILFSLSLFFVCHREKTRVMEAQFYPLWFHFNLCVLCWENISLGLYTFCVSVCIKCNGVRCRTRLLVLYTICSVSLNFSAFPFCSVLFRSCICYFYFSFTFSFPFCSFIFQRCQ